MVELAVTGAFLVLVIQFLYGIENIMNSCSLDWLSLYNYPNFDIAVLSLFFLGFDLVIQIKCGIALKPMH